MISLCPICSSRLSSLSAIRSSTRSIMLGSLLIVIGLGNTGPAQIHSLTSNYRSYSAAGKEWWTLYHTRLTAIKEDPAAKYRDLFTVRQWRQFDGFRPDMRRHRGRVNKNLLEAAIIGLKMAVTECKFQFAKEKWNCSVLPTSTSNDKTILGNLINKGVPESAFFHSILSASVTQAIAEACLSRVEHCPCNTKDRHQTPQDNFQWRGCDHNVHYGRKFARRLLDSVENGLHMRHLMNRHNNRAGRIFVKKNMKPHCRCHGTSGACNFKTCFRKTPKLREIGNFLKKKYTQIVRVIRGNSIPQPWNYNKSPNSRSERFYRDKKNKKRRRRKPKINLVKAIPNVKNQLEPPSKTDLVYYETLPVDIYCEGNSEYDTIGTFGRQCNSTSLGSDHCSRLCCGRGHKTEKFWTYEPCNCEFQWCCKVVCDKCEVLKTLETCK